MKILKEVINRYSISTKEYGDVIQVSKLEEMLKEFENKPFEDQLGELQNAMKQLDNMFSDLQNKIND